MGVTGAARPAVGTRGRDLVAPRPARSPTCRSASAWASPTATQAAEVAAFADGVIVGSAFVRRLLDARRPATESAAVEKLAAELADGVRRGR